MFWVALLVNQYIMGRVKFSDVYLYTPDSAVELLEGPDIFGGQEFEYRRL